MNAQQKPSPTSDSGEGRLVRGPAPVCFIAKIMPSSRVATWTIILEDRPDSMAPTVTGPMNYGAIEGEGKGGKIVSSAWFPDFLTRFLIRGI